MITKTFKKIIVVCLTVLLLCGCQSKIDDKPRPSSCGNLQVIDGRLCDKKGNPIILQGVSTYNINWAFRFINEDCFKQVSTDWHMNVIRLAMYTSNTMGYCKDGHKDEIEQRIYNGVEYATKYDMYCMIDWHILDDYNPKMHMDEAKEFFDKMSLKYKNQNNIIYEICNEPNNTTTWQDIKDYANEIIPIIRNNDPDAIVIVGTPNYSSQIHEAYNDPLDFDNILYTYHFYAASSKEGPRAYLKEYAEKGLPIFVTEYGVCSNTGGHPRDLDSADEWWKLMEEYGISSCMWDLSNVGEAASMIKSSILKESGYEYDDLTDSGKWLVDSINDKR